MPDEPHDSYKRKRRSASEKREYRKKRRSERRKLSLERARQRLEERRAACKDVVEYALSNPNAVRYLTQDERELYEDKNDARSRRRWIKEKKLEFAEDNCFYAFKDAYREGKSVAECNRAADAAYKKTMNFSDDVIENMVAQERRYEELSVRRNKLELVVVNSPGPGPAR